MEQLREANASLSKSLEDAGGAQEEAAQLKAQLLEQEKLFHEKSEALETARAESANELATLQSTWESTELELLESLETKEQALKSLQDQEEEWKAREGELTEAQEAATASGKIGALEVKEAEETELVDALELNKNWKKFA